MTLPLNHHKTSENNQKITAIAPFASQQPEPSDPSLIELRFGRQGEGQRKGGFTRRDRAYKDLTLEQINVPHICRCYE